MPGLTPTITRIKPGRRLSTNLLLMDPAGIKPPPLDVRGFFREVLVAAFSLILRFGGVESIVLSKLRVTVFWSVRSECFIVVLVLAFVTESTSLSEADWTADRRVLGAMVIEVDVVGF